MLKTSDFHPFASLYPSFFRPFPVFPAVIFTFRFSPSPPLIKNGNVSGQNRRFPSQWMPVDGCLFPGKSFPLNFGKLYGAGQLFFSPSGVRFPCGKSGFPFWGIVGIFLSGAWRGRCATGILRVQQPWTASEVRKPITWERALPSPLPPAL